MSNSHTPSPRSMAPARPAGAEQRDRRPVDDENFHLIGGDERDGGQSPQQRRASAAQAGAGNLGGQDSRDQGPIDPGAPPQTQPAAQAAAGKMAGQPGTGKNKGFGVGRNEFGREDESRLPQYESDTRESLSRLYAEHKKRQEEMAARGGVDPRRSAGPEAEERTAPSARPGHVL